MNAEVPLTEEAYLHRSGRTGRMGSEGIVITFVQDHTLRDLKKIARKADLSIKEIFLHGGQLLEESPEKEEMNRENEPHRKSFQLSFEKKKQQKKSLWMLYVKNAENKQKKDKNKGARRK